MEKQVLDMQSKNKIISIMQPTFLPWLGYFNMIKKSDIFVFFDDVQVTKRSWQTRNRIKTSSGEHFITIPVKKGNSRSLIKDCEICIDEKWKDKFFKTLHNSYIKSEHYQSEIDFIKKIFLKDNKKLSDFNSHIIKSICERLEIKTKFIFSSDLNSQGTKDEYLSLICKELNGDQYLSAQGSKQYIETGRNFFSEQQINVTYNEYKHPQYKQLYGDFVSHLAIIDAIFNIGIKNIKDII